jgi:peptidoglycan hydrolase CwlO-like protein
LMKKIIVSSLVASTLVGGSNYLVYKDKAEQLRKRHELEINKLEAKITEYKHLTDDYISLNKQLDTKNKKLEKRVANLEKQVEYQQRKIDELKKY